MQNVSGVVRSLGIVSVFCLSAVALSGQSVEAPGRIAHSSSGLLKVPAPAPDDPKWIVPNVFRKNQEKKRWCWDAVTQSILSVKLQNVPSQCEIAARVYKEDCCAHNSIKCEGANYVHVALKAFAIDSVMIEPDYDQVVAEIKAGNLAAISFQWDPSGTGNAHAVLAYGVYEHAGQNYLYIWEPYYAKVEYWSRDYVVGNMAWYHVVFPK